MPEQGYQQAQNGQDFDDEKGAVCMNGPIQNRECTDILCLLVFLGFMGGFGFVAMQGYKNGDPTRLAYPYDPDHRACGKDAAVADYPFIYWAVPMPSTLNHTVCVKECPTAANSTVECVTNHVVKTCSATLGAASLTSLEAMQNASQDLTGMGGFYVYPTKPVYGRICLPTSLTEMAYVQKVMPSNAFADYMGDVWDVRSVIMIVSFSALIIGFLFMLILKWFSGVLVWLCILMYFACLLGLTWSAFQKSRGKSIYDTSELEAYGKSLVNRTNNTLQNAMHGNGTSSGDAAGSSSVVASGSDANGSFVIIDESSFWSPMKFRKISYNVNGTTSSSVVDSGSAAGNGTVVAGSGETEGELSAEELEAAAADTQKKYKYSFYALCGFFVLSLVLLCCGWSKISLMIAILESAAEFVMDVWPSVLVAPVFYVIFAFYFTWWVATSLFLYTSGTLDETNTYPFGQFTLDSKSKYMFAYFVFGGLWCFAFLLALQYFIIASATCIWYFQEEDEVEGKKKAFDDPPIRTSIYRAFRYHLGSLGMGSFVLAATWFIRLVLWVVSKQAEKSGAETEASKKIVACLQCCLACWERFVKFLSEQAYIRMGLTGENFCTSAKNAFFTVMHNPVRYALVEGLGGLFITIGTLAIALSSTYIGYQVVMHKQDIRDKLVGTSFPCLVFFLCAYTIGAIFMNVYGVATEAILQCFCLDEKLNKRGDPLDNCPKPLRKFFEDQEN